MKKEFFKDSWSEVFTSPQDMIDTLDDLQHSDRIRIVMVDIMNQLILIEDKVEKRYLILFYAQVKENDQRIRTGVEEWLT